MEGQFDSTDTRVDNVAVWYVEPWTLLVYCHVELIPIDYGYRADRIGIDLFAEARVGPALIYIFVSVCYSGLKQICHDIEDRSG